MQFVFKYSQMKSVRFQQILINRWLLNITWHFIESSRSLDKALQAEGLKLTDMDNMIHLFRGTYPLRHLLQKYRQKKKILLEATCFTIKENLAK